MRIDRLAGTLLLRDWRAGELRTLVTALVIAVAAVSAIGLLTDRLGKAMKRESAELLGGDLVVKSSREPNPDWLEAGRMLGLETATVHEFGSVLIFGDEMLLASVKAVSDRYPLRGQMRITDRLYGKDRPVTHPPEPGNAWVDPRVLNRLGAKIGDRVTFGATSIRIDKVLTYEPDQSGSLFRLAPRLLVNEADLQAAQVLGPGSRVSYRYLFAGGQAETLRRRLEPQMGPGHELQDIHTIESGASEVLERAGKFLNLTALLAIVLAAVAIAMAARRYSQRHQDVAAMLRCIGARRRDITRLYLTQLSLLVIATAAVGALLGWLAHWLLLAALKPLLPPMLPAPGWVPVITALATGVLLTGGFALPPLLRLSTVPPLRVLRRDLSPMPVSGWLLYGAALGSLYLLLLLLIGELGRLLPVLAATLAAVAVTGALLYGLLHRSRHRRWGPHLLSRSIRNLAGHATTSTSQILAFGMTLMIMVLIGSLRTELLENWRLQLPEDVPNHFAFNIQPGDLQSFKQVMLAEDIDRPIYPIVRGRLVTINGEPVPISAELDTNRELNLTWTYTLPDDNEIIEGEWLPGPEDKMSRRDLVSVEVDYARRLGIEPGDTLELHVGGFTRKAAVTSLRSVQWESFTPNFYLIFTRHTLEDLPTTYLTSFYLPESNKGLMRALLERFPAITVIEVDALLERLQLILGQVTLAVEIMMVFVLLSGFTVLFAALLATADERIREGALMRAVGASRSYLRRAYLTEFALIGLLAGILAMLGTEISAFYLYDQIFDLDYDPGSWLWLAVPAAAALFTGVAGYLGTRQVVYTSPQALLKQAE